MLAAALVLPAGRAAADDALSAPSNLTAQVESPHEIRLSWYSSSGASGYVVYRDSGGNGYSFRELETTYSTSYTDRNVEPGKSYVYVVKAKKDSALSPASSQAKATTPAEAPNGLSASIERESVKLSWNSVSHANGYVVLRSTDSGGYSYREIGTAYSAYYTDSDVKSGKEYFYVVKAKTEGGSLSKQSNQAHAVMPLVAPRNVNANASSSSEIRLSWDSVDGANGYVIRRSTDSGGYSYREVGTAYNTSYTDSSLDAGKTYYYVIEAKSSNSKSAPSREAHATTAK
jgi:fibronectin type 3 domain-containing protein